MKQDVYERFWAKVRKTKSCWLWTAGLRAQGYGGFRVRGRGTIGAHIFSYEMIHGDTPKGLWILHRCDNKACVNPEHLYAGTPKDNARDRSERNPKSRKLTLGQADEIRRAYALGQIMQKDLAEKYGICRTSVTHIIGGKTYNQSK